MANKTGLIIKALSGFYYVQTEDDIVECRARGVFRKRGQEVFVGDVATVEMTDNGKGYVMEIAPRKNFLVRPPLANLEQLVLVVSTCEPPPNLLVLDRLIAIAERKSIEPVLVFSKSDLQNAGELVRVYTHAGFRAMEVSSATGEGVEAVRAALAGKISAFSGNTGVGKSSLLNRVDSRLAIPTAEISQKLGRGKHTTRHVELFPLPEGGYVADTPGFSSLDLEHGERVLKEALPACFREFFPYSDQCQYNNCSHTKERGCAVLAALERGEIERTRFESYRSMWQDAKDLKEWELK